MTARQHPPLPEWAITAGFALENYGDNTPPPGAFEHHIGPFYARRDGPVQELLFPMEQRHCNRSGIAHGGLLAAFTDVVCGRTLFNHQKRAPNVFVTVTLTHEFVGTAPLGSWLLGRGTIRQEGRSIVFIDCEMFVDDRLIGLSRCVMKRLKSE